jgi:hypothetical protein
MRLTIKKHHYHFLIELCGQMGNVDATTVLDYLLWELRKSNYQFGSNLQAPKQPSDYFVPEKLPIGFTPSTEVNTEIYNQQLAEQTDPIIERFISLDLCGESF